MDYVQLKKRLEHVSAIHVTPFQADGSVDEAALRKLVRSLVTSGLKVIVANGNTGEFYSLTLEECRRIVEVVVDEVGAEATVVAGVGYDPATVVRMSKEAEAAGAHAVMVHNPVHPYQMAAGLKAYYDRIAESVAIGVIPYVRNPAINIDVLSHVARHKNVIACKYAINDMQAFGDVVHAIPSDEANIAWICGTAEAWAPFYFAAGATGFTSGLANVDPRRTLAMFEALRANDRERVRKLWAEVRPFEELRARRNSELNVSVVKSAMEMIGVPTGGVRPPIAPLGKSEEAELRKLLVAWGLIRAA